MDNSLVNVSESLPGLSRKRTKQPKNWIRNKKRDERYSSKKLPEYPKCGHATKKLKCVDLNGNDIRAFHAAFYGSGLKLEQDAFLLKYCVGTSVSTHLCKIRKKGINIKYFVRKCKTGKMIPVCQKTFMAILNIKKDRIQGVVRRNFENRGVMPKERRGGDRCLIKFTPKRNNVFKFIKSLKGSEPHYCRSKSHSKIYLASDLSIKKLWRIYNKSCLSELQVKEKFFRDIFNTKFNLSFGTPVTDKCSACSQYQEKLKKCIDQNDKSKIIIESRLHRLKYKAFYSILQQEKENILTMSFDCQKNLSLPKLPDQSTYFSRQWSFYHFCIVTGNSKASLTIDNVHSYLWNETTWQKGSNEIASAVYHRLCNTNLDPKINKINLIADGCGGQNKNTSIMCMLAKWFLSAPAQIKSIEVIFPIVGHSFLPPDRVFARIEKIIRKREVIADPDDYQGILRDHGTIYHIGRDVPVYDWRKEAVTHLKPPGNWHFQFNQAKRFIFTKTLRNEIKIEGEISYRSNVSTAKFVTKKNISISEIDPDIVTEGRRPLNVNKIKDVNNLLTKHYGEKWRDNESLHFYKNLEEKEVTVELAEPEPEENICEAREDEVLFNV